VRNHITERFRKAGRGEPIAAIVRAREAGLGVDDRRKRGHGSRFCSGDGVVLGGNGPGSQASMRPFRFNRRMEAPTWNHKSISMQSRPSSRKLVDGDYRS